MEGTQLLGIFLTGLFAGGLSCMAVQGGLLAATVAQRHELHFLNQKETTRASFVMPLVMFLGAKLFTYTLLGFFLGWLGSLFQISLPLQIFLQFVVGIFLIGTALSLLHVHPIFRYFVIQPPRFVTRLIRSESKSKRLFAPAILGVFTVFLPCGTTQAIMALSIASGDPIYGAALLFAFVLGTTPLFFVLGYFASRIGNSFRTVFAKVAAVALLLFALLLFDNTLALSGSQITGASLASDSWCLISYCDEQIPPLNNDATITIGAAGYSPSAITVGAGLLVTVQLTNLGSNGCPQAFTIPQLGLQKIVPLGKSETLTFTAPSKPEKLSFMCSSGMYRGTIHVI